MTLPATPLTSLANPRVKRAVKLRQRSHRDALGLMLIEGYRELRRALENNHPVEEVLFCPELFQGEHNEEVLRLGLERQGRLFHCTPPVFRKMSYRDRPDGLLAVAPQLRLALERLTPGPDDLLVVAESIEKPGNLGTILRSADGAGAAAVIVCDRCTDINNPNVVRSSVGTLFALPVIEAGTQDALEWLTRHGFAIVSTTPHTDMLYTDADLTGRTAIVLGTEQYGLSEAWLAQATRQVRIPMLGQADSLNVAQAATLLLYEAVRQRGRQVPRSPQK